MQNTINPRRYPPVPPVEGTQENPLHRTPFDFAVIVGVLLVLLLTVGAITWQFWHVNRIYGGVTIANVTVGGMTRAEALETLARQIPNYPRPAISLTFEDQQWLLQHSAVDVAPDFLTAVNDAYLVGRYEQSGRNFIGRLGQQLVALFGGFNITPPLAYDRSQLQQFVYSVAAEANRNGYPARQLGDVTIAAVSGITVDTGATIADLVATLERAPTEAIQLPLVVTSFTPQAPVTDVAVATDSADNAVSGSLAALPLGFSPLRLVDERYGTQFAIDPVLLRQMMVSSAPVELNENALRQYLFALASQLDVAPRDARLRFNAATGGVTVMDESYHGRQLDIGATIASVRDALANGRLQAALVINDVAPAVDMDRIAEMGIRELVASGVSYFRGSSVARVRNIEVAAEKFEGLVIPPGELFSFNDGVEDVTAANGFEDSLVILGDTTAVGVGGGVCQVSTTIFRAAYSAGFPIVERYNHGYVVSWYGDPGLDATIYTPTVDFRFRNDTNAYLLIEPVVDSIAGTITFNLYGTKPDRVVTVGVPQRSDVIEPEPPAYRINDALAAGERKQVEWEQKGMTVSVERTIVENGTTRTDTLTSVYLPWQAVYEVGPGTEIPATPTPAVAAGSLDPSLAITPTPSSPRTGP